MRRLAVATFALILLSTASWNANADPASRLSALLDRLDVHPTISSTTADAAAIGTMSEGKEVRTARLTDTGSGAESLFCLNFDKQDTKQMLGVRKSHAYVCFNFLQNPSEAVGTIFSRRGRDRCLITGFFGEGATIEDDCLLLAFCNRVFVSGNCT